MHGKRSRNHRMYNLLYSKSRTLGTIKIAYSIDHKGVFHGAYDSAVACNYK